MSLLRQWVGKTEIRQDVIDEGRAAALAALLDRDLPLRTGTGLPPLWHWIYFWSTCLQSQLGADGHPKRGGFLPPVSLPRRMWAGGRFKFGAPLPIGAAASRTSRIMSVAERSGQGGSLVFVTVSHEIAHDGAIAITEEHDIVYREAARPAAVPAVQKLAPASQMWARTIDPDPVLLFRYSALTFNGHRIHYDRSYATECEAYPGLVVHGPLIATLLVDLALQNMPGARLREFSFRAIGPLFDIEHFEICGQPDSAGRKIRLWAKNPRGELVMQAEASFNGQ
jgi:3-methylfumaryl-CoA hydratase